MSSNIPNADEEVESTINDHNYVANIKLVEYDSTSVIDSVVDDSTKPKFKLNLKSPALIGGGILVVGIVILVLVLVVKK